MNIIIAMAVLLGLIIGNEIYFKIKYYKEDKNTKINIKDYCCYQINRIDNKSKKEIYTEIINSITNNKEKKRGI